MYDIVEVTGCVGGECYLILCDSGGLLFDTGFGFCAAAMADRVDKALGGRPLLAILLTHSHYDHTMGTMEVKRRHPSALVVCSPYAARVFQRPGAWKVMRQMDAGAAADAGRSPSGETEPPRSDRVLEDGEILEAGPFVIRAMATPGHTHCSMSFYFPEADLLATSESTCVMPFPPEVIPAFLTGYGDTLESIGRSRDLGAEHLLVPHTGLLSGQEAATFFDRGLAITRTAADFVIRRLERGEAPAAIVEAYKAAYYTRIYVDIQPERAFLANTRAMVSRLLEEWKSGALTAYSNGKK